jgi:hypothetical protein
MNISEIAPDVYRFSLYVPEINLQFNQFLVKDDEPLLFHTGMRAIFPLVCEAVAKVIDPADLRWIGFSHFEADECGSLNEWLEIAPNAAPVCSQVGALVSVNDFASRPAKGLTDADVLETGKYRYRFIHTPHLPHCWEAGSLFEEVNQTLFCSDIPSSRIGSSDLMVCFGMMTKSPLIRSLTARNPVRLKARRRRHRRRNMCSERRERFEAANQSENLIFRFVRAKSARTFRPSESCRKGILDF